MPDISISVSGVHKLLSDLNPFKATGPDAISARFLKETANEIAPMLTCLFNQSLATGEVPQDWKKAYVIPIYKKGSKSDPRNYRPVSLTSIVCKTMEHILSSQIMHHIESQGIICSGVARPGPTRACALPSTFQALPSAAQHDSRDSIKN